MENSVTPRNQAPSAAPPSSNNEHAIQDSTEESGWTYYVQDLFLPTNSITNRNIDGTTITSFSSGFNHRESSVSIHPHYHHAVVSDALSSAKAGDAANEIGAAPLTSACRSKYCSRPSLKRRKPNGEGRGGGGASVNDRELEDTATSPANSPKVSWIKQVNLSQNEKGKAQVSEEVEWGEVNMIEAERRLLANALLDFSNQRFVLLSESCIPLYNFRTIYNYLVLSKTSFVESYDLAGPVGQGRYNKKMRPRITLKDWRKGAQWFEMDRDLGVKVVSDRVYFPLFKKHCLPPCYSDEHYIPTLVRLRYGPKNANRTLHWVDWSKGGAHPARYGRYHITYDFLEQMRNNGTCDYNGKQTRICHLFARKFMPVALDRLLRFAPKVMNF